MSVVELKSRKSRMCTRDIAFRLIENEQGRIIVEAKTCNGYIAVSNDSYPSVDIALKDLKRHAESWLINSEIKATKNKIVGFTNECGEILLRRED